jgi:hypothetical protein
VIFIQREEPGHKGLISVDANACFAGQRWAGSWTDGKPQWVQPLTEGAAAADLKPEEAANMSHALAAAENAQNVSAGVSG